MERKKVKLMANGYAFASSRKTGLSRESETVMIVDSEAKRAVFQGYEYDRNGELYCRFKIGRRYYWQLASGLPDTEQTCFTQSDVMSHGCIPNAGSIVCEKSELLYNPTRWQKLGLRQTSSGYGKKLNSGLSIFFVGKWRRIYVTCWSNAGSYWFMASGKKIFVN